MHRSLVALASCVELSSHEVVICPRVPCAIRWPRRRLANPRSACARRTHRGDPRVHDAYSTNPPGREASISAQGFPVFRTHASARARARSQVQAARCLTRMYVQAEEPTSTNVNPQRSTALEVTASVRASMSSARSAARELIPRDDVFARSAERCQPGRNAEILVNTCICSHTAGNHVRTYVVLMHTTLACMRFQPVGHVHAAVIACCVS